MENTVELLKKAKEYLLFFTNRPDLVFEKGQGSYLWDTDGNKYLDMIAGWAVCCLGHSPKAISDALTQQASILVNPSPSYYNVPSIEFAELLCQISCMDKVFFTNSGAEANEGAIKLARKYGSKYKNGAYEIVSAWNGFHGRTLSMMSVSGKRHWDDLYSPKPEGFRRVRYNDIEDLKAVISPNTCAIILELVQGEGGVIVCDEDYIKQVRLLCDENNIILILDEVQTGLGRLGYMFGYEAYGVEPDIMTLAKGIGGGVPLSAMLVKDKFCCFDAGDQGGTYCSTPIATAVGKSVVEEIIKQDLPNAALQKGRYLTQKLMDLKSKHNVIDGVRGKGLLLALVLKEEIANRIKDICMNNHLLINAPNSGCLRFMPALNVTNEELDEAVYILDKSLSKIEI